MLNVYKHEDRWYYTRTTTAIPTVGIAVDEMTKWHLVNMIVKTIRDRLLPAEEYDKLTWQAAFPRPIMKHFEELEIGSEITPADHLKIEQTWEAHRNHVKSGERV